MITIGRTPESQGLPMAHPKDLQDEVQSILNFQSAFLGFQNGTFGCPWTSRTSQRSPGGRPMGRQD